MAVTPKERQCLREPQAFSYCGENAETVRNVVHYLLNALEESEACVDMLRRNLAACSGLVTAAVKELKAGNELRKAKDLEVQRLLSAMPTILIGNEKCVEEIV